MDYIVLDMEWNQPWPGSPSARKVLPVQIRGEIIQMGAVRVSEEQLVLDEFQVLVRPKFYRSLNRRVSKLTGIKESRLKAEGIPFAEAIEQFRSWCGEDVVFLTWGFDDITILRENLQLHELPYEWVDRWSICYPENLPAFVQDCQTRPHKYLSPVRSREISRYRKSPAPPDRNCTRAVCILPVGR